MPSDIYTKEITLLLNRDKSVTANFSSSCGDINGDLNITPTDAQIAFDAFLGNISNLTDIQKENADVNCDGTKNEPKITPGEELKRKTDKFRAPQLAGIPSASS